MNILTHSSIPTVIAVWRVSAGSGPDGQLLSNQPPATSLDEASLHLPAGAYTTFRTYHRDQAFHLEDHLSRLEESARLAGLKIVLDRGRIRAALRQAISSFGREEARIRLNLDLSQQVGEVYLSLEGLRTPSERQYAEGVKVITVRMARENPKAKLTGFIHQAREIRRTLPEDAVEGIMLDPQGDILEGLSSNFFGVIDGEIYTSNQGVFGGITRALVIEEASQAGYPIHLERLPFSYSQNFSEAFITSSSRAVLPVVQIDQTMLGSGQPGRIAQDLLARYLARIEREISPI